MSPQPLFKCTSLGKYQFWTVLVELYPLCVCVWGGFLPLGRKCIFGVFEALLTGWADNLFHNEAQVYPKPERLWFFFPVLGNLHLPYMRLIYKAFIFQVCNPVVKNSKLILTLYMPINIHFMFTSWNLRSFGLLLVCLVKWVTKMKNKIKLSNFNYGDMERINWIRISKCEFQFKCSFVMIDRLIGRNEQTEIDR